MKPRDVLRRLRSAGREVRMPACSWCDKESEVIAGKLRACDDHLDDLARFYPQAAAKRRAEIGSRN